MIYAYTRVSTLTQSEHGGGLDVQREQIERYAGANAITIDKWFTDAGISGTTESRPALDEMLEILSEGDTIIVSTTSRLWRGMFAQAYVMKVVMKAGANIKSVDEPAFDIYKSMNDPENFMITSVMGMLDQWERMTIARKLARGRATKAGKGIKPAGVMPLGYRYSDDKKSVEVEPAEADTVRMMFRLGQTGKSLQEIADAINATGAITRHGKQFSKGTVSAILNNRFYLGELQHAGKTIKGAHTGIISAVQFGKVQAALARRKRG